MHFFPKYAKNLILLEVIGKRKDNLLEVNLPSDWWAMPFTPSLDQGLLKIPNICYQKVNVTSRDFILWSVFTLVPSKAFMELLYTVLSLTQSWDWILHFFIWLRDKVKLTRSSRLCPGPTSFAGFSPNLPYGARLSTGRRENLGTKLALALFYEPSLYMFIG